VTEGPTSRSGGRAVALISIVTPAYNESANLPILYKRIVQTLQQLECSWEWIVVDDHSWDATFDVIRGIAATDSRVHGLRLARNSGSHLAVSCGLKASQGQCAVILAADLQDPPETIADLMAKWRGGAQIVWAVRARREGVKTHMIMFGRLYYWIMRRIIGMKEMPAAGADFFLIDRSVVDVFRHFRESNISILALFTWMGFRQEQILYVKQARLHGTSGWNLTKMLKLVVDSITSFSYVPIRLMSYTGFVIGTTGLLCAIFAAVRLILGYSIAAWMILLSALLVLSGVQIVFMGVLGEYLWRTLDEARRRPRFIIEDTTPEFERLARDGEFLS